MARMVFMRFVAAVVFSVIAVPAGCRRGGIGDMPPVSAKKNFSDPQQLKLAEAVEKGDPKAIAEALRLGVDKIGTGAIFMS